MFVVCRTANINRNEVFNKTLKTKYTEDEERLALFAKAMGHPTRIVILKFLASQNECFFGDIHDVLPIAKATVSQHLSLLKEAGLIQGEIFPPKVKYCINPVNWEIAKRMFEEMMSSYKKEIVS